MSIAPFTLEPGSGKIFEFTFPIALLVYYRVQSDQPVEVYFLDSANKAKFDAHETFRYMGGPTGQRIHEWRGAVAPGTYFLVVGNSSAARAVIAADVRSTSIPAATGFPGSGLTGTTGFPG